MKIQISVPATSANFGCGFDSIGIALQEFNHFTISPWDCIDVVAEDGFQLPQGDNHLVVKTIQQVYEICGSRFHGVQMRQKTNVPVTRGLGSSSTCIVAGLFGGNYLLGNPLSFQDILNLAAEIEGHPDNSTAAIVGGMTVSAVENGKVFFEKLPVSKQLRFAVVIPNFKLKTKIARGAIPQQIPHKDAVHNLSRVGILVAAMFHNDFSKLRLGADDRLHQSYRLQFIPGAGQLITQGYDHGAYAGLISGAGPSILFVYNSANKEFLPWLKRNHENELVAQSAVRVLSPNRFGTLITEL